MNRGFESRSESITYPQKTCLDCGNGRAAISPDMALRIEAWLGVDRGGDARAWLAQQSAYDVWQAEQRFKEVPMRVQPAPATA